MQMLLEMTFIPNVRKDCFFIWCTTHTGQPVSQPLGHSLEHALTSRQISHAFKLTHIEPATVLFDDEEGQIEVHGLFVPMMDIFYVLQSNPNLNPTYFQFGETFLYWQKIAAGLAILIENGHYYPTLFSVEKEHMHHYFAHWLLGRRVLNETNTLREWMAHLPPLALSATDLAPIPVRQWFDVLLDTWTDQIVRRLGAPAYENIVRNWPDKALFEEFVPRWFYFLTLPEDTTYFLVTEEQSDANNLHLLMRSIHKWHAPMVDNGEANPLQSLIAFKKTYMAAYITPVSLIVQAKPVNPTDPFRQQSEWKITLAAIGEINNKRFEVDIDTLLTNHPSSLTWLSEKMEQLADFDPVLRQWFYRSLQSKTDGSLTGKTVFTLYNNERQLEDLNVVLRFPDWLTWKKWTEKPVAVTLHASTRERSDFSLSSIVQFNWKVTLGDLTVPLSEFKRIVYEQRRFLKHQGEWVELPLEKMQEALTEMEELQPQTGRARKKGSMADVLRLSLASKQQKHVRVNPSVAVEQYLTRLNEKPDYSLAVSQSFRGTLRPYQQQGYAWLSHLRQLGIGGCLADDMGLGKTIQTIAYLLNQPIDQHKNPALIICPTSVLGNWKRELQQFAPSLRVYVHHGPNRYQAARFTRNRQFIDVMLTSYPLATRDHEWLCKQEWPVLIIDEAQAIKNPATKQSQAIRKLQAQHRIALTGTPMENRLEELWSIMDFLNPGYLGSLQGFKSHFITPIEKHQNRKKAELLKRIVQPFLMRREKTDKTIIHDLPDKYERKEHCPLSTEQAALYQTIVDNLKEKMRAAEGIERKGLILATLTKLKQVCNHPALVSKEEAIQSHSGKLTRCFALLDPLLAENESCLVFTQYVRMGRLLQTFLQERYGATCPVYFLHGGLPSIKREEMIRRFRAHGNEKAVFILSLKAGGLGLNLTEANHVIHYDRWWNPAVEDQATDRSYRIGQKRDVHVYKLICEGTLEENIDHLINKKRNLTEQIIGRGSGWITELSDDEVMELIQLREKAVS